MPNPFFNDEYDITDRTIWKNLNGKSHCSIASVIEINSDPVSVNIQPLINYFDEINGWTQYPILQFVPISQLQTASYSINTPLNIGDVGIVIWFDREVYTTLLNGATAPNIPDSGDLTQDNACVFIPIMQAFSIANPLKTNGVDILSMNISLLTQLINTTSQMINLISDLNNFLSGVAATPSSVGDTYATNVAIICETFITQLSPINMQLNLIKNNFTVFKGAQT